MKPRKLLKIFTLVAFCLFLNVLGGYSASSECPAPQSIPITCSYVGNYSTCKTEFGNALVLHIEMLNGSDNSTITYPYINRVVNKSNKTLLFDYEINGYWVFNQQIGIGGNQVLPEPSNVRLSSSIATTVIKGVR